MLLDKKTLLILATVIIISVIIIAIFVSPSTSPISSIKDTDNDGVPDDKDTFPTNSTETKDSDKDGIGDNNDAFPNDPAASIDTDRDGFPNSWNKGKTQSDSTSNLRIDAFPNDPAASVDTDSDGYPDAWNTGKTQSDSPTGLILDAFPNDPTETKDTDGDKVGDSKDKFPNDSTEWDDSDNDGVGNNKDAFPNDPTETKDTDKDGVGDNADIYDNGNGGIKISIVSYKGDGGSDEAGDYDIYFVIKLDTNGDDVYDEIKTSTTTNNVNSLSNPYAITKDIADGAKKIKFTICVYDADDWSADDVVDYTPDAGIAYEHTVYPPFTDSWKDDGNSTPGCTLQYKIEVVPIS